MPSAEVLSNLEDVIQDATPGASRVIARSTGPKDVTIDVELVWYAWALGGLYHWAVRKHLERLIGGAATAKGVQWHINVRWW